MRDEPGGRDSRGGRTQASFGAAQNRSRSGKGSTSVLTQALAGVLFLMLVIMPACAAPRGRSVELPGAEITPAERTVTPQVPQEKTTPLVGSAVAVRETPVVGNWRVQIPAIGVDAPIVVVGLEADGAMAAPEGPEEVGWYQHGPAPGERGNVLMDGHVDWTNRQTGVPHRAVFWSLRQLNPGARVAVTNGSSEIVYEVVEKKRYRYDDPAGMSVLQRTEDARLTLITCGGTFDRATRTYDTREIIIARLVA